MPMPVIALVVIVVLTAAVGIVVLGMGPFAPRATDQPTPGSIAQQSGQPTPGPTVAATNPTNSTFPSPTTPATSSPPATPGTPTDVLLGHVPQAFRGSCTPGTFAEPAVAAITCAAENATINVTYTLYADQPSAAAQYDSSVIAAGIEGNSGRCYTRNDDGRFVATRSRWPSENGYTINDEPVGRYLCYETGAGVPSIAWTDDRLYILAVAMSSGGDIDRLVDFWANEAGPVQ